MISTYEEGSLKYNLQTITWNSLHSLPSSGAKNWYQSQVYSIKNLVLFCFKKRRAPLSISCFVGFCWDDIGSSEFTIYEMMNGCYVWSVRPTGRGFFFGDQLV
nr:hypothetical protein [Tanacetum cinerariifolium]